MGMGNGRLVTCVAIDISEVSSSGSCDTVVSTSIGSGRTRPSAAHQRRGSSERQRSCDEIAIADKNTVHNMACFITGRVI